MEAFFAAIKGGKSDAVRQMVLIDKDLLTSKLKTDIGYGAEVELDALKFLGAYIGSVTGLQFAILSGNDDIAKDLIDRTMKDDLDQVFGGGNTAIHLATLLNAKEIVKLLIEQGASTNKPNSKGYLPVDLADAEMKAVFR